MPINDHASSCLIVIFGASGDLTKRKLIPALYDLYTGGQMPDKFAVMGLSRSGLSDDDFRDRLEPFSREFALNFDDKSWAEFAGSIYYHAADSTKPENYEGIKARMAQISEKHDTGENVLFYLSMAPQLYEPTLINIGSHNMVTEGQAWCSINRDDPTWQRIIIEKPFGHDPDSAARLNRMVGRVFQEESVYRIDHYLGKETVQNLLVFRFANAIFEPIWNRNYIDHIQVTAAETVGVEDRGGYYDSSAGGAMRDMIQSHLLQVMAVIAMEPPISMSANDIRMEKTKVFNAVHPPNESEVAQCAVRGQYGPGMQEGEAVVGYRQEKGVDPESQTDTYAALQCFCDTWRWQGVPFYVRSGKSMAQKLTEVVIKFKRTPHCLFGAETLAGGRPPNEIVINIQPDEGISLRFEGKVPGLGMKIKTVEMDFDYVEQFKGEPPQAYSTLLLDAMRGDQTLFKHRDEIESAWRIVQPVLDVWSANPQADLPNYAAGTWGPSASDDMMSRDGRQWHNP